MAAAPKHKLLTVSANSLEFASSSYRITLSTLNFTSSTTDFCFEFQRVSSQSSTNSRGSTRERITSCGSKHSYQSTIGSNFGNSTVNPSFSFAQASVVSRFLHVVLVSRQGDSGQDTDNGDNDHQLDQGETFLQCFHVLTPVSVWQNCRLSKSDFAAPCGAVLFTSFP